MWKPTYQPELYHHGVKGMKWGVRRYQPYSQVPRKSGMTGTEIGSARRKNTAGETGVELAIFATYYSLAVGSLVYSAVSPKIEQARAKKFIEKTDDERDAATIDKKTGLRLKSTNLSEQEDLKRVNPEYRLAKTKLDINNIGDWDPAAASGATNNCVNCTMAYEMRQRGFEVQAKLNATGRPGTEVGASYFKGAKTHDINKPPKLNLKDQDEFIRYWNRNEEKAKKGRNTAMAEETINAIKKNSGNESRGQICVKWNRSSGHSMAYKVDKDGNFSIIDGQCAKTYGEKEARKLLSTTCSASFQRLDNCECDYKKVKEGVR